MKKLILLAAAFGAFFSTKAQESSQSDLSFGARVAYTSNSFAQDYYSVVNSQKRGVQVGGTINYKVLSFMSVRADLVYSFSGARNIDGENFFNLLTPEEKALTLANDANFNMHDISLPVKLSFNAPNLSGPVQPFVTIGGGINMNIYATSSQDLITDIYDDQNNQLDINRKYERDATNDFNQTDYFTSWGAGVLVNSDNLSYIIEANYNLGMSNINAKGSDIYNSMYSRNAFVFGVSVLF